MRFSLLICILLTQDQLDLQDRKAAAEILAQLVPMERVELMARLETQDKRVTRYADAGTVRNY